MATSVSERNSPVGSPPGTAPQPGAGPLDDQYDRLIELQLNKTRRQLKLVDLAYSMLILAAGVLLYFLNLALLDHWIMPLSTVGRYAALLLLIMGVGSYLVAVVLPLLLRSINPVYAARAIERSRPTLKNSLVNFLFLRGERIGLRQAIYDAMRQRAAVDLSQVEVETAVDSRHVIRMGVVVAVVFAVGALYLIRSPKDPLQTAARVLAPWAAISQPTRTQIEDVQPGNQDVFHGQSVEISARLVGVDAGSRARVVFSAANQQVVDQEAEMRPSPDGLRWQATLPVDAGGQPDSAGLRQSLRYYVAAGDAVSPEFQLKVIPAPTILVKRVEYEYPAYTGLDAVTDQDFGDIRALEGTRVTIHAEANLPIGQAFIEFDPMATEESLEPSTAAAVEPKRSRKRTTLAMKSDGQHASGSFVLRLAGDRQTPDHASYQVRFRTADGHAGLHPVVHDIQVVPDLAPEVAILRPAVSPAEVPEDGSQRIEIRAVDPDFGLSRIRLRAVVGGTQLLDALLFEDSAGQTGQTVVNFQFQPRQLGLAAGDRVMVWAVAEDNRTTPGSGQAEPNVQRTRNTQLIILPPQDPNKPDETSGRQSADQGDPGDMGPQEGEPGAEGPQGAGEQGGAGDADGGQSGKGDQAGQPGQNPSDDAQTDPQGQKGPGQAGKGGRPSPEGGEPSEGDAGQSESGTPGSNPSGNKPAGKQPPGAEPGGQDEPQEGDASGDRDPQSQAGGSGTGKPGAAGKPDATGKPGTDPQSGENNPQDGANPSGEPSASEREEPLHDGEVIEKINELLREKNAGNSQKPASPPAGQSPQDGSEGGKGGEAGTSDKPDPGAAAGSESGAGKSGETAPSAGQEQPPEGAPAGRPAGENDSRDPAGGPPKDGDQSEPGRDQGDVDPSAGDGTGGSGGQPKGAPRQPTDKPKTDAKPPASEGPRDQQPQGGLGDNGESGAGTDSPDTSGAAETQGENRDRPKSQDTPGDAESKPEDAQSPSGSKKQSDSQGDSSGDRSGGGSKGAGQAANQKGNDSAGSNSPADSGASAAPEAGQGETSDQAGDQQTADKPTGNAGNEKGAGSQSRPKDAGDPSQADAGDSPGGEGASQPPGEQPKPNGPRQTGKGTPTGPTQGGGVAGDGQTPVDDGSAIVPDGEQANLEYARKATDLALEYLEGQQDAPDRELLDKLGWTPDELRQFVQRWKAIKQGARDGQTEQKSELDDALRSLGLRPVRPQVRQAASQGDQVRGLRESGTRTAPPSRYRELFESYQKATSRRSGG